MELVHAERPADGKAEGLLILHHGRGSDERDLLGLGDVLDPDHRLHLVTPRAPLTLPGSPGFHWYIVPRVGYPDHDTFHEGAAALAAFHQAVWRRTGLTPGRTVLGGFSQGSVMSYALGLAAGRPAPAGILAFAGFIPTVDGFIADPGSRPGLPVFIGHGRADPVMDIAFARSALATLRDGGATVEYHESDIGHAIDPSHLRSASAWLGARIQDRDGAVRD